MWLSAGGSCILTSMSINPFYRLFRHGSLVKGLKSRHCQGEHVHLVLAPQEPAGGFGWTARPVAPSLPMIVSSAWEDLFSRDLC